MTGPAVVILAGGAGVRMGGGKATRRWCGQRLIDRALDLARGYGDDIAVSVRHPGQIDELGAPELADASNVVEGPLAGLCSALQFARSLARQSVLTIPCDSPLLPPDLASSLSAALVNSKTLAALPRSGGNLHPACGLWDVEVEGALPDYVASGRSSLWRLAQQVGMTIVDWDVGSMDPFSNANTPQELARIEAGALARFGGEGARRDEHGSETRNKAAEGGEPQETRDR